MSLSACDFYLNSECVFRLCTHRGKHNHRQSTMHVYCVLIHLRNICDFTSCSQCLKIKENGDINNHLTSSTKNDQEYFLVIKTQNILRFSKSIYIHYINTIVYHYYIGRLYSKAEQRVSSHLNTFIVF